MTVVPDAFNDLATVRNDVLQRFRFKRRRNIELACQNLSGCLGKHRQISNATEVIVREFDEFVGELPAFFVGNIQRRCARNCSRVFRVRQ